MQPDQTLKQLLKKIGWILSAIGLVSLAGSLTSASQSARFIASSNTASATVVRNVESHISSTRSSHSSGYSGSNIVYSPEYVFQTPAGKNVDIVSYSATNPARYQTGDKIEVLYDPAQPQDARINSFFELWFTTVFSLVFGLFFCVGGMSLLYGPMYFARRRAWLRQNGTPVSTKFDHVGINVSFKMNGQSPWQVFSQGLDPSSGSMRIFHSENLWFDPTNLIKPGQPITVYIDRNKPSRYAMDTDFLPKPS